LALKTNGNRGAQQEIPVSTKVSKEIVPFQQKFQIPRRKNPTSTPSVVNNPTTTPPKNLRLRLCNHGRNSGVGAGVAGSASASPKVLICQKLMKIYKKIGKSFTILQH